MCPAAEQVLPPPRSSSDWTIQTRRYVPTLLNRRGEREALAHASEEVWSAVIPLIQVELRRSRQDDHTVAGTRDAIRELAAAVGPHVVYLDVLSPKDRPSDVSADELAGIHEDARRIGLRFIPVHTLGTSGPRTIAAHAASDERKGLFLRYRALQPHLDRRPRAEVLAAEVEALGLSAQDIDLSVDFGWWPFDSELDASHVTEILTDVSAAGPWRTTTFAGTSIPRTLEGFAADSITPVARREWALWEQMAKARVSGLRYGDYGVQHPRWPYSGGGRMWANVRYAIERATLVGRGSGALSSIASDERPSQYRAICQAIMSHPAFAGRYCCWGDEVIEACAQGRIQPGTQEMWRGVGTSHHLRIVTLRLAVLEDQRETTPLAPRADRVGRRGRAPFPEHARLVSPAATRTQGHAGGTQRMAERPSQAR